jgi:hypothetical protein
MYQMEDSMLTLHESIAFGGSDADAIRIIAAHHNLLT